jgi:primary-amine oxidase
MLVQVANIVRTALPGKILNFRVITLKEPLKKDMISYLEREHTAGDLSTRPPREARVQIVLREAGRNQLHELVVNIDLATVIERKHLEGKHPCIDSEYMNQVEAACRADSCVQAQIKTLHLPAGATVVIEPWAYATDGTNDMTSERTTMCWFYMRLSENADANYYAYPLDICAEVSEMLQVTKVYRLPLSEQERIHSESRPFDMNREQDVADSEYHPDLRPSPRATTKPLQVVQSDGVSFKVTGNHLAWEKWTMRVGFNYREGITLHDVRYDGRSLFYRISLAEMFVPYGDPRPPFTRKAAFDLGNDGAGLNANNLQLGCDCLGSIKYFDGWHNTSQGLPLRLPNVICCHEQDDGILWKHTNFRTGNAVVTRSRILVLQTIITVSNYEYIFAFHFGQDASIHYEVRATGILSTVPMNIGEELPFGTVVAPGTLAPYHQHLFSLRFDPALDGHANSLLVEESHPMVWHQDSNPLGIGYTQHGTIVENEGGLDLDHTKGRTFKIINENIVNPITGTPVGYKLLPAYSQMLLAHPESFHAKRSEFGQHAMWVTRYDDEEIFPSGRHTMQSLGEEGIATGIKKRRNDKNINTSVRNEDIVVWHTFGSTHNPRIEDWPVMPSEKMTVGLKPANFFTGNPGIDVATSNQATSCSSLVLNNTS